MGLLHPVPPGTIVLCDYDAGGFKPPEMVKVRPVVVISPRLPHREGLATVVPLSTTPPPQPLAYVCELVIPEPLPHPFGAPRCWAKADMVATVGFHRLNLFRAGKGAAGRGPDGKRLYLRPRLTAAELARVRAAVMHALGCSALISDAAERT